VTTVIVLCSVFAASNGSSFGWRKLQFCSKVHLLISSLYFLAIVIKQLIVEIILVTLPSFYCFTLQLLRLWNAMLSSFAFRFLFLFPFSLRIGECQAGYISKLSHQEWIPLGIVSWFCCENAEWGDLSRVERQRWFHFYAWGSFWKRDALGDVWMLNWICNEIFKNYSFALFFRDN